MQFRPSADWFEQARWVGIQVSGQAEQPRVLLLSAPYALKAGDAETVGGLPPSAFMLAAPYAGWAGGQQTAAAPRRNAIQGTGGMTSVPRRAESMEVIPKPSRQRCSLVMRGQ